MQTNSSRPKDPMENNSTMGNSRNVTYQSSMPEMFNSSLQPLDSIPATKWHRDRNIDRAVQIQRNPYADPTQVSKGITWTQAGGSFTLYDKTGGTKIFDYNPATGVVTIAGSLVANQVNTGTYSNITIAGTDTLTGTLAGGMIGTSIVQGGTVANALVGTSTIQGGTSTSQVINSAVIGTSAITGGTMNNAIVGTPAITGGTMNNAIVGTRAITGGTMNGIYQATGTAGVAATAVYVKTVNFAGSSTTLGTLIFAGGLLISSA